MKVIKMHFLIILTIFTFYGISEADELWLKYDLPDTINCITSYGDYIWMGTENGVAKMNRNNGTQTWFTSDKDSLAERYVDYIVPDKDGHIFAGAKDKESYYGGYYGGLSIYDGESWSIVKKNLNGLIGNDIRGLGVDNKNVVWIALNNSYTTGSSENDLYFIDQHIIQNYNNLSWQIVKISTQNSHIQGNWVFYPDNILAFGVSESGFFAYAHLANESYNCPIYINNFSLSYINYEGIPYVSWVSNIKIEENNNSQYIIWVNNYSPIPFDNIYNIVYRIYNNNIPQNDWTVLTPSQSDLSHTFTSLIVDQFHNKWFVDRDEANKKYLIKYDDTNYIPYTCPSWSDSTEITALYADEQGFIWVGTQSDGLYRFDAKNATIVQASHQTPAEFTLSSPYPNPFNAQTMISFTLTKPSKVNISIYSLTGQKVRELAAGDYSAGNHTAVWDGKNEKGETVSSGLYLARMESGGISKVVRMAMVK